MNMNDVEFAFSASERIGRLYRDGKRFSSETPIQALSSLRGLASAFCDLLDRDLEGQSTDTKIRSLHARGMLTPAARNHLRTLQRNGNRACHPESYDFETHDFPAMAQETLIAARGLIEQFFHLSHQDVPKYEVAILESDGLRDMCYSAMIEATPEAMHQAGIYFKEKADQLAVKDWFQKEDGYGMASRAHIEQAMFWFKQGAHDRHPDCMYQYGLYLANHQGDNQERRAEGERLIAHATSMDHADALVYVAHGHLTGRGIFDEDLPYAREFYEQAARQDHPEALSQLGIIHAKGIGCDIDPIAAAQYIQRAAEAGYPTAQYNLFVLYQAGAGVERDTDTAVKWLTDAANQAYPDALFQLGILTQQGRIEGQGISQAFRLYERCLAFPAFQSRAAMVAAELTLTTDDSVTGWVRAAHYLLTVYEAIDREGDCHHLRDTCLAYSEKVLGTLRRHISRFGPDPRLQLSDLLVCLQFDERGVPTPGKHLAELSALLERAAFHDATAVNTLLHLAGIEPLKHPHNALAATRHQPMIAQGTTRPGRNDPCSCGSGQKYKKCCGA